MTKLCFDFDFIIFEAVSVAEEKFITATHTPSNQVMEFDNVTQLWGHHKKKIGGWIGSQNELAGSDYYKSTDFTVVPGQRLRPFKIKGTDGEPDSFISPFDGAKKILNDKIRAIMAKTMADSYFGYTGRGEVFRHELATLLPYKGNRNDLLTPLLLGEMKQYVIDNHNCELVEGIEADDACSIATIKGYKEWKDNDRQDDFKVIQVAIDKDAKQTEGWHFNPNKDSGPRLVEGFGKLWLNAKGEPDGDGRIWLYWQILHGDSTDGYKANCFSEKAYAGDGAYNDLVNCKTDKEAWAKMVEVFKWLYPEKKVVEGCKGSLKIDWIHVLQEMTDMAFMLRHNKTPRDRIDVKTLLTRLEIKHD